MEELFGKLTRLLSDVVVPSLRAVQINQREQIATNNRVENAIGDLRSSLETQYAQILEQLTACRAELAATQAVLHAAQMQNGVSYKDQATLIH
jgi:hypothetical protein